jgi:predicted porin
VKRILAGGTLAAAVSAALGQSVTVYGLIDVAVERVDHVGADRRRLARMASATGTLPSRLGLRGSEDLGGGLRAVFVLEQGFAPDGGSFTQGGRAFGRQSWVGLAGPWGSFTVGRQYTMLFWSVLDADILGTNIYGSGSLDPYIPNARADNAIAYRGTFSGLTVGATYSVGRDGVNAGNPAGTNCAGEGNDGRACREWSLLAKYDGASWGAALAVDEIRGGPGAFAGLASSAAKDTRLSVNAYADLVGLRIGLGLIRRDNDGSARAPRSDLWYAGVLYAATPLLKLDAEAFRLDYKGVPERSTLVAVRAAYSLSKRTAVYATVGHIANDGTQAVSVSAGAPGSAPFPGAAQSGVAAGLRYSY